MTSQSPLTVCKLFLLPLLSLLLPPWNNGQCGVLAHYHRAYHAHSHDHHDHHHDHHVTDHEHDEHDHEGQDHRHLQQRSCATPDGDGAENQVFREWLSTHKCTTDDCPILEQTAFENDIEIFVVWHDITRDDGSGGSPSGWINSAMSVLNSGFSGTGFRFTLTETKTTASSYYYLAGPNTVAENAMKSALRSGDCSILNIYSTGQTTYLGWATLPSWCSGDRTSDGVVINYQTSPGGNCCGTNVYNLGDTLTHEVGHWMGLYHTFQGGCFGDGDFVADTPPEAYPDYDCQVGRDTCSGNGQDDITNFMNYGEDNCIDHFTTLQIARMNSLWDFYRNNAAPTDPPVTAAPTLGPGQTASPSVAPQNNPVSPPTGGAICFSEEATLDRLQPQDGDESPTPTPMSEVEIGDKVMTGQGRYQAVYGFAHNDTTTEATFLRIHTASHDDATNTNYDNDKPLEISPLHLVYVADQDAPVTAESIQVGDHLVMQAAKQDGTSSSSTTTTTAVVTRVESIQRSGLYAPMTPDGTVVVDGVVSSCYVSLQPDGDAQYMELRFGNTSPLSHHFMAHILMTVPRLACIGINGDWCRYYNDKGVSWFVQIVLDLSAWFLIQPLMVQYMLLALLLVGVGPLYVLEGLVGAQLAVIVLGGLILSCVARRALRRGRNRQAKM